MSIADLRAKLAANPGVVDVEFILDVSAKNRLEDTIGLIEGAEARREKILAEHADDDPAVSTNLGMVQEAPTAAVDDELDRLRAREKALRAECAENLLVLTFKSNDRDEFEAMRANSPVGESGLIEGEAYANLLTWCLSHAYAGARDGNGVDYEIDTWDELAPVLQPNETETTLLAQQALATYRAQRLSPFNLRNSGLPDPS